MQLPEIKSGYDSLGALLFFSGKGTIDKSAHWYGSSLSTTDVKKLGFKYSNPTVVQVAISILVAMDYIENKHADKQLMTPEDLDYKYIISHCKKYLGRLISKSFEYTESNPLSFDKFIN